MHQVFNRKNRIFQNVGDEIFSIYLLQIKPIIIADTSNIFGEPAMLYRLRYPLDILNIWLWLAAMISCSMYEF
jgi:hypothetical protein